MVTDASRGRTKKILCSQDRYEQTVIAVEEWLRSLPLDIFIMILKKLNQFDVQNLCIISKSFSEWCKDIDILKLWIKLQEEQINLAISWLQLDQNTFNAVYLTNSIYLAEQFWAKDSHDYRFLLFKDGNQFRFFQMGKWNLISLDTVYGSKRNSKWSENWEELTRIWNIFKINEYTINIEDIWVYAQNKYWNIPFNDEIIMKPFVKIFYDMFTYGWQIKLKKKE